MNEAYKNVCNGYLRFSGREFLNISKTRKKVYYKHVCMHTLYVYCLCCLKCKSPSRTMLMAKRIKSVDDGYLRFSGTVFLNLVIWRNKVYGRQEYVHAILVDY